MARKRKKKKLKRAVDPFEGIPEVWKLDGEARHSRIGFSFKKKFPFTKELPDEAIKPSYRTAIARALGKRRARVRAAGKSIEVVVAIITPCLARLLLRFRANNRKVKPSVLKRYIGQVVREQWCFTGQPIILDEFDRLLDGQHRLAAVVEGGKPIEVLVVRGIPRDNFRFMDTGSNRSAADMVGCFRDADGNEIEGGGEIASAILLAVKYARTLSHRHGLISRTRIEPNSAYDVLVEQKEWLRAGRTYRGMKKHLKELGLTPSSCICAIYFTQCLDARKADEFWEGLATGVGLRRTSPILAVRNFCLRSFVSSKEKSKAVQEVALDVLIQGWNLLSSGAPSRKSLSVTDPTSPFPRFRRGQRRMRTILSAIGE